MQKTDMPQLSINLLKGFVSVLRATRGYEAETRRAGELHILDSHHSFEEITNPSFKQTRCNILLTFVILGQR